MTELLINANISEIGGAYFQANLQWVPRVGELIDLYSFADQHSGHPPVHRYEVVQVVHKIHDVVDKASGANTGAHFVTVHVKPATSQFFGA